MTVVEFSSIDQTFDKFGTKMENIVAGNGAMLFNVVSFDLGSDDNIDKEFQFVLSRLIKNIATISEGKYNSYFPKITKTFTSIFFGFLGGYNLNGSGLQFDNQYNRLCI